MKIHDILRSKGHDVVTITESRTVLEAAQALVEQNIGGLVVIEDTQETESARETPPTGILTERDILRLTAQRPGELDTIQVGAVMTRELITVGPTDDLATVMDLMTENRIRHLPVMEGDQLVGIISIGDLVNAFRVQAEEENSQLREYIQGAG